MYGPKKYSQYIAPYSLETPEPTFYSPERELAANAEQMNILGQSLSTMGDPRSFMANMSSAQSKGLENAANILSRYNNLNVGEANRFAPLKSQIRNQERMGRAQRATDLAALNNQEDIRSRNSGRGFLADNVGAYEKAYDNRYKYAMLNATQPMLKVDPWSGRVTFKGGFGFNDLGRFGSQSLGSMPAMDDNYWANLNSGFLKAQQNFPGLTPGQYFDFIGGRRTVTDRDGDGIADNQRLTMRGMNMMYGGYSAYPF